MTKYNDEEMAKYAKTFNQLCEKNKIGLQALIYYWKWVSITYQKFFLIIDVTQKDILCLNNK